MVQAAHPARLNRELHLMAKHATSQTAAKRKASTKVKQPPALPRPGGKLGVMIDLLATKDGATAAELAAETGWQRHSVLGALSRLRSRGFAMHIAAEDENAPRTYRLDVRVVRDDLPA